MRPTVFGEKTEKLVGAGPDAIVRLSGENLITISGTATIRDSRMFQN